jgi:hypothetical protein
MGHSYNTSSMLQHAIVLFNYSFNDIIKRHRKTLPNLFPLVNATMLSRKFPPPPPDKYTTHWYSGWIIDDGATAAWISHRIISLDTVLIIY